MYLICSPYLMDSLTYLRFIAGFTLQFVYAAFVEVGFHSVVFGFGLLLYCVRAFERYFGVCLFKEVCGFSDFGTMKYRDGPFLVFVLCLVHVGFVLSISLQFCYVMKGNLMFSAMERIFCLSVSFLSAVRCNDVILLVM